MAKLTIKMLKNAGACAPELTRLKGLFGSSVKITEEFCVEHASECNWDWARRLLSLEAREEFSRVQAAAQEEYGRVLAPAREEYSRVQAAAWAEYSRVTASAREENSRVLASARAELNRVLASAWARLWIQDHTCKGK